MTDIKWQNSIEYSLKYKHLPPDSFFYKLETNEIGLADQSLLIVACNNGNLANYFAKKKCQVSAIDISDDVIDEAKIQSEKLALKVDYHCMPAENIDLDNHSFDVVFVYQALKHFDKPKFLNEAKRLLVPGGRLVVSENRWLPRLDIVAKKSDEIFLSYNKHWNGYDYNGEVPAIPDWAKQSLILKGMFVYDEALRFTKEEWIGRLKADTALSGTLSKSKLIDFENDFKKMLDDLSDDFLDIHHRIHAHILEFK